MKEHGIKVEVPDMTIHHQIHSPPMDWGAIFGLAGIILAAGLILIHSRK